MITIEQAPQPFHPAFNGVYFILDSTNKTNTGFRYIVAVEVDGDIVGTYRLRPTPNAGLGEVDISKVLQTLLTNDFQQVVSYDAEGHYINYNLVLSEEYFVAHALFGARVATGTGTWAWPNWSNLAFNPTGANLTQWASLTEPPFEQGDSITINQITGLIPSLEGNFTVVDKFLLGGFWYIVVNLPWIGGGVKGNTATSKFTDGQKFVSSTETSDTFTAWRGAFRFADFPNYDNEKYLLDGLAKELLTTMPDTVRISRTTQTRFALRFGETFNFWVFADWGDLSVTNQATFIVWVEANSDYTVDSVTDFSLVGTQLKCNIAASGGVIIDFSSQGITDVKAIGNGFEGIQQLRLTDNSLTSFNLVLPLPTSLTTLRLISNDISDWSLLEPWITAQPAFTNPCNIATTDNPTSAIGTTFETIALAKNAIIIE